MTKKPQSARRAGADELRLGFVPLTDCAPLVMARETGLFERHGLRVRLSRELGWATVRDKVAHGELDAAHALAAMPLAATLGLGSAPVACLTSLVLNLNGNAITLANELWRRGVRDGHTLRAFIQATRRERLLTFGVVFPFSSHRQLLRQWLCQHGIDPERDARIVTVPPPQLAPNLRAGNLDGFCSGEPWNSVAVESRAGWVAATSAELDPGRPEKVLMVRRDFAQRRAAEHLALVAALEEACAFCQAPANRPLVAATLARPEYAGVPEALLRRGLEGRLEAGHGRSLTTPDFFVFHGGGADEPSGEKAAWLFELVRSSGLCPDPARLSFALCREVYRADLFEQAMAGRRAASRAPGQSTHASPAGAGRSQPGVAPGPVLEPAV